MDIVFFRHLAKNIFQVIIGFGIFYSAAHLSDSLFDNPLYCILTVISVLFLWFLLDKSASDARREKMQ